MVLNLPSKVAESYYNRKDNIINNDYFQQVINTPFHNFARCKCGNNSTYVIVWILICTDPLLKHPPKK